jgi:YVTN family beta-propeller protein
VSPDSKTLLAVGGDSDSATLIGAATPGSPRLVAGPAVAVGYSPAAVAITKSGQTGFVVNTISGTLTPITLASGHAGKPVSVGLYSYPTAITLAPAGSTAVVVDTYGDQVSLVNTSSRRALKSINVGSYPVAVAIAP